MFIRICPKEASETGANFGRVHKKASEMRANFSGECKEASETGANFGRVHKKKPRRGLILITPYKRSAVRWLIINTPRASRRDATLPMCQLRTILIYKIHQISARGARRLLNFADSQDLCPQGKDYNIMYRACPENYPTKRHLTKCQSDKSPTKYLTNTYHLLLE